MTMDVALDILAGGFLVVGAFLSFAAGMGILHFPDLLARMHAGTKPQVLGMLFMLIALGIRLRSWSVAGLLLLVIAFQMLTAPVAAHMVARAGYRTGKVRSDLLAFDELLEDTEVLEPSSSAPAEVTAEVAAAVSPDAPEPGLPDRAPVDDARAAVELRDEGEGDDRETRASGDVDDGEGDGIDRIAGR